MDDFFGPGVTFATYDYSAYTQANPCVKDAVQSFSANFLPWFYYVIFTLSLLGNGLVLFVVIKFERLQTVTNIFLLNLVGSNLMFTFSLPFWAEYHVNHWWFGETLCKLVGMTGHMGINSSVLFLLLLTIDRYLAVVHAVAISRHCKSRYAMVASVFVWVVCGLASVGPLLDYKVTPHIDKYDCKRVWEGSGKHVDGYIQFVGFFLLPLLVVIYSYVRIIITVMSTQISGKHRTLRIIFVILVLFFSCWTPYNIVHLIDLHNPRSCNDNIDYALYVTHNISNLYFCINPVFYTFVGRKFQNYTRKLILGYFPCLADYLSEAVPSQTYQGPQSRSNRTTESVCEKDCRV